MAFAMNVMHLIFQAIVIQGGYGTGYLVNWARNSLGANGRAARTALIELPAAGINSHQDVVNAGYADRYINATLYMLRVLV